MKSSEKNIEELLKNKTLTEKQRLEIEKKKGILLKDKTVKK